MRIISAVQIEGCDTACGCENGSNDAIQLLGVQKGPGNAVNVSSGLEGGGG